MSRIFLIMLVIFSLVPVLARAQGAAQALADKSDQLIVFYDETGAPIARFQAAFGRGHGPKIREGDMRTPEGDYWLMPARVSDDWHYFLAIDYPNANDLVRARGGSVVSIPFEHTRSTTALLEKIRRL